MWNKQLIPLLFAIANALKCCTAVKGTVSLLHAIAVCSQSALCACVPSGQGLRGLAVMLRRAQTALRGAAEVGQEIPQRGMPLTSSVQCCSHIGLVVRRLRETHKRMPGLHLLRLPPTVPRDWMETGNPPDVRRKDTRVLVFAKA